MLNTSRSRLTESDWEQVQAILSKQIDFVDNDAFHQRDAEAKLFDPDDEVPEPEVGWYMDYLNARDNVTTWAIKDSVHKNVTLSKKQESVLFLRFNYARYRLSRLVASKKDNMTDAVAAELIRWHRIVMRLRNHITMMNLAMVISVATRSSKGDPNLRDMVAEGNVKLMRAVEKFDIAKGWKFSTYAWWAVLRIMLRVRLQNGTFRERFKTEEFDADAIDQTQEDKTFEEQGRADEKELVSTVLERNLANLSNQEQFVVKMRYLEPRPDGKRYIFAEIANMLGVSRANVQLIEARAKQKLEKCFSEMLK